MNQKELDKVLELHGKWLRDEEGGSEADLRGEDLRGADLSYVDLSYVDLSYVDLSYVDLRCADLSYADLSYADLRGADLRGADLSYAGLNWCNWQDVTGITVISAQVNTNRKNNQISYLKNLGIWTTGCFQGTTDELKAQVAETHVNNEFLRKRYERVIDFILRESKEGTE